MLFYGLKNIFAKNGCYQLEVVIPLINKKEVVFIDKDEEPESLLRKIVEIVISQLNEWQKENDSDIKELASAGAPPALYTEEPQYSDVRVWLCNEFIYEQDKSLLPLNALKNNQISASNIFYLPFKIDCSEKGKSVYKPSSHADDLVFRRISGAVYHMVAQTIVHGWD